MLLAAFDYLNHGLLLKRLSSAYGIERLAHSWLESYLAGRAQVVKDRAPCAEASHVAVWGPTRVCARQILFTMYTAPIGNIVRKQGLAHHLYADDTQLYFSVDPDSVDSAVKQVEVCIAEIAAWMGTNNCCSMTGRQRLSSSPAGAWPRQLPRELTSLLVRDSRVVAAPAARNLCVVFDNTMRTDKQVDALCKAAHYHLSNIGRIRHPLSNRAPEQLTHAFVTARLDNENSLLLGITKTQLARLQRVQNLAARIVTRTRRREHITPVLHSLHWLPVSYRIQYKVLLLTFKPSTNRRPHT